ncbi:MAG: 50S ribosomal protein L21 [Candidatus Dormibacteria bacterium]
MYAIVQVGGRQYRATPGDRLVVDRMDVEPGSELQLPDVRMLVAETGDSQSTQVGRPRIEDAFVAATALGHFRGPKMLVFKYKPKKRYRRKRGFRAELTELRIDGISLEQVVAAGESAVAATTKPAAKVPAKKTPAASKVAAAVSAEPLTPPAKSKAAAVPAKPRRAAQPVTKAAQAAAELADDSQESGDGA